jgi:hypothetical protein
VITVSCGVGHGYFLWQSCGSFDTDQQDTLVTGVGPLG